jgi:hypothetical protein
MAIRVRRGNAFRSNRNICEKLAACVLALAAASLVTLKAAAADYPAPKEGGFLARDFRFHRGEVMPELRLHYTTIGAPRGERDSWIPNSGASTTRAPVSHSSERGDARAFGNGVCQVLEE